MEKRTHVGNVPVLRDGDIVMFEDDRKFNRLRFGSISGYAAQYHEHEAVPGRIQTALENGHRVVWLNAEATVISDPPQQPKPAMRLRAGQLVFVDSIYPAERGYWQAFPSEHNYKTGDNGRLDRPQHVYEVWAADVACVVHEPNAAASMIASLIHMGATGIHAVKHNPNEYSLSGFAEL